jgi:hypothetical protein
MTRDSQALGRRCIALVLAILFLLQSAAQAGSGCLASVIAGECCCEAAVDVAVAESEAPSCCSERGDHSRSAPTGPIVEQRSECGCDVAPPSSTPADKVSSEVTDRAREKRDADGSAGFARWIAEHAPAATLTEPCFDPRLRLRPPRPTGPPSRTSPTLATTRLAHRGVIGLLSELCTVRS